MRPRTGRKAISLTAAVVVMLFPVVCQAGEKLLVISRFEHGKPVNGELVRLRQG